jgi:predicted permease
MIRTFRALMHVDPGFSAADQLQTFHFWLPGQAFPNTKDEDLGPKVLHMQQAIRDKLAAMPGVQSVSFSANVPMDGSQNNDVLYAEDHVAEEHQLPHVRRFYHVSPGFFSTMGTRFLAGRDLTWSDMYDHLPVALISENFAREYWGSAQNALGKRIRVTTKDDWRSIIGVVQDVHVDGVDKPAPTMVFWPTYRTNFEGDKFDVDMGVKFVVRSPRAGSQAFMNDIQQQVWSVNSTMPLSSIRTEGELYKKSMARTSFMLVMLCVAGSMALLLGVIGIYGVISYTVSQRTREIGIRMALGAQRSQLTSLFVRQGLWLTLIGSACGLVVAFVTMRLMASVLFDVSPVDPLTYIVITIGVGATTCLACYIPSRRAATVNPVTALRSE